MVVLLISPALVLLKEAPEVGDSNKAQADAERCLRGGTEGQTEVLKIPKWQASSLSRGAPNS